MKKQIFSLSIFFVLIQIILVSCVKKDDKVSVSELKNLRDSASFALGYLNGMQASMDEDTPVNADLYARGFKQAYEKDTTGAWSDDEIREVINAYARLSQAKMQEKSFQEAKPDLDRAEEFLDKNKQKAEVQTTDSGLQYQVIKQGKGKKPALNNGERVIYQYTQYELNENNVLEEVRSNVSDSGKKPGPTSIDGLCEGVKEALTMMNAGSEYTIWFHPNLGYGYSPKLQMYKIKVFEVLSE